MIKRLLIIFLLNPTLPLHSQCVNILQNPGAEEGLTGWNFTSGDYSSWEISEVSEGNHTFTSSTEWSTKSQLIDLTTSYSNAYLDSAPEISVQEMYKGHTTTNINQYYLDNYYFRVELRNASGDVLDSFNDGSTSAPLIASNSWQTSKHTFTSYGTGLRFIYVESGGSDTEGWVGFYGTRIDNTEIKMGSNKSLSISGTNLISNASNSSYQWLDCGRNYETIPGEINQSYTATTNGNYAVEITLNSCIDTSACQSINKLSIFENHKETLAEVYPNPSSGDLHIDLLSRHENITITLKSILGQIVLLKTFKDVQRIKLEINELPGLYVLEVEADLVRKSKLLEIVK